MLTITVVYQHYNIYLIKIWEYSQPQLFINIITTIYLKPLSRDLGILTTTVVY